MSSSIGSSDKVGAVDLLSQDCAADVFDNVSADPTDRLQGQGSRNKFRRRLRDLYASGNAVAAPLDWTIKVTPHVSHSKHNVDFGSGGPAWIARILQVLFQSMSLCSQVAFTSFMQEFAFNIGSVCSGTSAELVVAESVALAFGDSVLFRHCWGCDNLPDSQIFNSIVWAERVNKFAMDFMGFVKCGNSIYAHDYLCQREGADHTKIELESVDFLWAGIPCVDASNLNPKASSSESRECCGACASDVAMGSKRALRTGSLLNRLCWYLAETKTGIVVVENVLGLLNKGRHGVSNKDFALAKFRALGYFGVCLTHCCASNSGTPQSRPRFYFILVSTSVIRSLVSRHGKFSVNESVRRLRAIIQFRANKFAGLIEREELSTMLLQEDDVVLRAYVNSLPAAAEYHPKSVKEDEKWVSQISVGSFEQMPPGMTATSLREHDALCFEESEHIVAPSNIFQDKRRCVRSLSGQLSQCSPCITCNSRIWFSREKRFMHPLESLRVQISFESGTEIKLRNAVLEGMLTWGQVQKLSGNAFTSSTAAMVKFVALSSLASVAYPAP